MMLEFVTSSSVGRKGRGNWELMLFKICWRRTNASLNELENTSSIKVNNLNPRGIRTNMRKAAYPAENPESVPSPEILMPLCIFV